MPGIGPASAADIAIPIAALLPPPSQEDDVLAKRQAKELEREKAARARLGFDAGDQPTAIASPHDAVLPKRCAILGTLPPSAPLSVADAFLSLADLPAFDHANDSAQAASAEAPSSPHTAALARLPPPKARLLVLTGPRVGWHLALEDQDPTFLRGHDYVLFDRLRRIDTRYCPSVSHLRLLLTVLNGGVGKPDKVSPPAMIVLYDVLGLLMGPEERDENAPPEEEGWAHGEVEEGPKVLRPGVTLSTYLEIVSAALDVARAFGEDGKSLPLLILEPHGDIALPLLAPAAETAGVPQTQKTRTFKLSDGLRRLGLDVGEVTRLKADDEYSTQRATSSKYELSIGGQVYPMSRSVGTKAEFACPPREQGEPPEEGGWVWSWE